MNPLELSPLSFAGALIAGGKSGRFGTSKAGLPLAGGSLGAYVLGRMRLAGLKPLIYNASESLPDLPGDVRLLPDRKPGQGPLGGLATVLANVKAPVLVAACDMPGLDARAFESLVRAWKPGQKGLVARGEDGWHPLLGIYDPSLLPEIRERLKRGQRGMHGLVEAMGLDAWTPEPAWVVNVNTPEEWEQWRLSDSAQA